MKKIIVHIFCVFLCGTATAQNLVPNPGFEMYNDCPQNRSGIVYSSDYTDFPTAQWWVSALWNTTPDYYNTCATNPLVTLPYNTYNDYQQPHGGEACAGISMLSGYPNQPGKSDYREYLEARLLQPMIAGKKYYLSFFVNYTFHLPTTANQIVIDMVGAKFTDTQIKVVYPFGQPQLFIEGPPDIFNERDTYISDTAKWENIKGVYTAHGGEQWLTIGYFKDSLPINFVMLHTAATNYDSIHRTCYMYVDDVCVTPIGEPVHDTIYVTSFPAELSAGVLNGQHKWNTGDTTPSISAPTPGTYQVLTTDDCFYREELFTILCITDTVTGATTDIVSTFPAEISGNEPNGTHLWNTGATTPSITINTPGTYWVENYYNCIYSIDTITILCDADVRSDTLIYASTFPFQLINTQSGDSVRWYNYDTTTIINVNGPGVYYVTVWQGCRRYITRMEVVYRDIEDCIWMPSAFTPNGDGRNDEFGPTYTCYLELPYFSFSIYNRFGELVFKTTDITRKWDGNYNGQKQELGAYYYMVRYSRLDITTISNTSPELILKKGDVTLIR